MTYDDRIAQRIRDALRNQPDVDEKRMFGGLTFMVRGNMCCGVVGEELVARVGPEGYDEALRNPYARPMDFTGKPMKGFVYVAPDGFASDLDLQDWIDMAVQFVETLPAK